MQGFRWIHSVCIQCSWEKRGERLLRGPPGTDSWHRKNIYLLHKCPHLRKPYALSLEPEWHGMNLNFWSALWRVTTSAPSERRRCPSVFFSSAIVFGLVIRAANWDRWKRLLSRSKFGIFAWLFVFAPSSHHISLRQSPLFILADFRPLLLLSLTGPCPPFWGGSDVAAFTDPFAPSDGFAPFDRGSDEFSRSRLCQGGDISAFPRLLRTVFDVFHASDLLLSQLV